jgi:hypothetical protein
MRWKELRYAALLLMSSVGNMAERRRRWRFPVKGARARNASFSNGPTKLAIAMLLLLGIALAARSALAQDDDWSVVSDQIQSPQTHRSSPSQAATVKAAPVRSETGAPSAAAADRQATDDGARMICGEMARPATEPYKSIVENINREWGTNARVYESVRPDSPHVSRAGCIFYNPAFIAVFLRGETDEHGEPDETSMLYAIMAHELGHIEHHDYTRTVSSVTKELEADRFSGYTLERMGISRGNITPFYSLGGDEFSGVHDHGFSNQRISAFDKGWKEAEWNRPEDGGSATASAAGSGAGADDSSGEDEDSSAAAAVP